MRENCDLQIQSLCNEIESQLQQQANDLNNRANQLQSQARDADGNYNSMCSELQSIQSTQIPNSQSNLNTSNGSVSDAQRTRATSANALATAQQALTSQRLAIGFDAIEKSYNDSQAGLKTAQHSQQANVDGTLATQKAITLSTATIAQLGPIVARQTFDRDTAQLPVTMIQTQLAPQRAQETDLIQQVSGASMTFDQKCAVYQQLYILLTKRL